MGDGDAGERELSNWLEDVQGYYAQRTGASGSATDRARADVVAMRETVVNGPFHVTHPRGLLIEFKGWSDGVGSLDGDEIAELTEAAHRAGAEAWVVVKPDQRSADGWECYPAEYVERECETDSGNYYIGVADREVAVSRSAAFDGSGGAARTISGP